MSQTLSFIGAGNMAEAIARSAIGSGIARPQDVTASDRSEDRRAVFTAMGCHATPDNAQAIRAGGAVVLSIKPQVFPRVAPELAEHLTDHQVVISIMAGLTCDKMESLIGKPARLVRVMPNTPVMVGQGMSAIALGPNAEPGDDELAIRLFESGGKAIRVDENALDAVTAVSGSGPAYAFYLAEAMEAAAAELGLGDHARLLAVQTLLGAATLLSDSQEDPAELRRRVTSPGGTTEAAITSLDQNAVRELIAKAIHAAAERSAELRSDGG
ncbi:MAG: pyrroline-5-carboxylate reductase [Planctomycetota bacterium]